MLLILLLVTPAYGQEESAPPTPPELSEQMQEIEEQVQVQVENTMAICAALGIVCEEEAASKLVEALNELVITVPALPVTPSLEEDTEETEDTEDAEDTPPKAVVEADTQ